MPDTEQFVDLLWPAGGVDVSTEYEDQNQLSTPLGVNVRTFEPTQNRARGGQRSGLTKYIAALVGGPNKIQHLNSIVDPSAMALLAAFDPLGGGAGVPDPSTNNNPMLPGYPPGGFGDRNPGAIFSGGVIVPFTGRYVRAGGSGIAPNRKVVTRGTPGSALFVQKVSLDLGPGVVQPTVALTFPGTVAKNDLLVVSCQGNVGYGPASNSVMDTLGSTWQQLNFGESPGQGFGQVFWALAGAT